MRTARVIATTVVTLLLSATLTPAHADDTPGPAPDCQFSNAKVTPSNVVVGISKVKRYTMKADAAGCETYDWGVVDFGPGFKSGDFAPANADHTKWTGFGELDPDFLVNADAGKDWGQVTISDDGETRHLGASLTVRRNVLLPEVAPMSKRMVKKSKSFWVGTYIDRADWNSGKYGTYENKLARLQFRTKHGHYKTIKKVRSFLTAYEGTVVETKMKTKKSGYYRFLSDATPTTSKAVSKRVYVKVKS